MSCLIYNNYLIYFFRELFYQNVVRFRNQSNLDVAVRDVCCLLETPPWELSINATAKGLVAGPLTIETSDGKTVDCSVSGGKLYFKIHEKNDITT